MIRPTYNYGNEFFVKDVLEQAIDKTYQSSYWGDEEAQALYKIMMSFGGGIMTDVDMYYEGDMKAFNKSINSIKNVVKSMEKDVGFENLKKLVDYKKIISSLEQGVSILHNFTYNMSNISYRGEKNKEEEYLKRLKSVLSRIIKKEEEYRRKIHFIHQNKERLAVQLIFE